MTVWAHSRQQTHPCSTAHSSFAFWGKTAILRIHNTHMYIVLLPHNYHALTNICKYVTYLSQTAIIHQPAEYFCRNDIKNALF